jgi:hypothetical protein
MKTCYPEAAVRSRCVSPLERPPVRWAGTAAILIFAALILCVGRYKINSLDANIGGYSHSDSSSSPYATSADFTKYALKLRAEGILRAEPIIRLARDARTPWKQDIVTTVFWVGERAGSNNPVSNDRSSWDTNWTAGYGGLDPPEAMNRRNYIPVAFIPRQNPFYVALPYNDVTQGQFKPEAALIIPWFKRAYTASGQSVCKDHWVAIRKENRICYAQWEDCGPFRTDHFQYVFGNERPTPNANAGAGLDVSPAVRDYLGLQPIDITDWQFVEVRDIPQGPWRIYGDNNPFAISRHQASEQLATDQAGRGEDRGANLMKGN